MNGLRTIGLVFGLLLGSLVALGSTNKLSYRFYFQRGSTSVDLSRATNGQSMSGLLTAFSGNRFLGVEGVAVVGVADTEGNYRANWDAARKRAETVADLIKTKYSWMFVDDRVPLSVDVQKGAGAERSVRVDVRYCEPTSNYEPAPIATVPEVSLVPAQQKIKQANEEQGVFIFPNAQVRLAPKIKEPLQGEDIMAMVALKTNLLFDLATVINLEVELPIGKRWSMLFSGVFPAWNYDNHYCVRILETSIEGRYWFPKPKERLTGHFLGAYAHWVVDYDLQWDRHGVMGSGYGFGLTYGYAHTISRHFGLEYSLGVGLMHLNNTSYGVTQDYQYKDAPVTTSGWRVLPTRAKVSLVWRIGGQKPIGR